MRVNDHRKSEVRRHALRRLAPRVAAVVRAVEAEVVLEEEPVGFRRVARHLVDALAELRVLLLEEVRLDPAVARLPRLSAVVRPVDAAGRGRDPEAVAPLRVRQDGVEAETAAARHPAGAVRVIPQPLVQGPGLAAVPGLEQRGRLDAAEEPVRLVFQARLDLPDVLQRHSGRLGERDPRRLRPAPLPAEVVGRAELGAEVHARGRRPDPVPPAPPVVTHRVDGPAREVRTGRFPAPAGAVRPQEERALHRADQKEHVAVAERRSRMFLFGMAIRLSDPASRRASPTRRARSASEPSLTSTSSARRRASSGGIWAAIRRRASSASPPFPSQRRTLCLVRRDDDEHAVVAPLGRRLQELGRLRDGDGRAGPLRLARTASRSRPATRGWILASSACRFDGSAKTSRRDPRPLDLARSGPTTSLSEELARPPPRRRRPARRAPRRSRPRRRRARRSSARRAATVDLPEASPPVSPIREQASGGRPAGTTSARFHHEVDAGQHRNVLEGIARRRRRGPPTLPFRRLRPCPRVPGARPRLSSRCGSPRAATSRDGPRARTPAPG